MGESKVVFSLLLMPSLINYPRYDERNHTRLLRQFTPHFQLLEQSFSLPFTQQLDGVPLHAEGFRKGLHAD